MTGPAPTKFLTVAEYDQLPEGPPYYQLIDGELIMSPSPTSKHQRIVLNLAVLLTQYGKSKKSGQTYVAPLDVELPGGHIVEPDVMYISRERAEIIKEPRIVGAPDLVVEVLSPANARLDRQRKRELYAASGVRELWIVDPDAERLEVFRLAENAERPAALFYREDEASSALLPGLAFSVGGLFAE
ncbi:MAG: Uma2 family endonuclease [Verrucomicrobiota bacterium]